MITNTYDSFLTLWRLIRETQDHFKKTNQRFCIRRMLQYWHKKGIIADEDWLPDSDEFIWEICFRSDQQGYNELPPPELFPRPHREMLRALVAVVLGLSVRQIDIHSLDRAYSEAFPGSTPLNICKKKR